MTNVIPIGAGRDRRPRGTAQLAAVASEPAREPKPTPAPAASDDGTLIRGGVIASKKPRNLSTGVDLARLVEPWETSLDSNGKAKKTIRSYADSAKAFVRFLEAQEFPTDSQDVEAPHIRRFLIAERERTSPASAATHYRNLRVWWGWIQAEGERTWQSPMATVAKPKVPAKVRNYISDDDTRALLKVCAGGGFEDRRDTAIIRILMDNGARVSGVANIMLKDLDLRGRKIRIVLKGGDEHWAPIGAKAANAVDRYLRVREKHPKGQLSPYLWLGVQGHGTHHFTSSGVRTMLARRTGEAKLGRTITPHEWRGTVTHNLLKANANEIDVQHILGWKSTAMVHHYGSGLAQERARETHARLSPGDRI